MADRKILKVTVRNKKNMHSRNLRDYMAKIHAGLTEDKELTEKYHVIVTTDDVDMEVLGETTSGEPYTPSEWVGAVAGIEDEAPAREVFYVDVVNLHDASKLIEEFKKDFWKKGQIVEEPVDLCSFIEENIKIRHPVRGICDLELYPHQYNAINEFEDNQMNFVLGARQTGITSIGMVYAMAKAFTNPRARIHFFSNRYDLAGEICREMANSFDISGLLLGNMIAVKNKIDFYNNSIIRFKSINDVNVSKGLINKGDIIIIDDAGFARSTHENYQMIERALSVGAKIIMLATAEPKYDSVFSAWNFSYTKIKSTTILAPWTSVRRKKGFKEEQIRFIGKELWRREYDFL